MERDLKPAKTDWDGYYARPYRTASLTRRHTASVLVGLIRENGGTQASIVEFGGANSCFIDQILEQSRARPIRRDRQQSARPRPVEVALSSRWSRLRSARPTSLAISKPERLYDIAFSVGLIEHFEPAGTAQVVQRISNCCGRAARRSLPFRRRHGSIVPCAGWRRSTTTGYFHDERPLDLPELERAIAGLGRIESARILWPLILTQYCLVARKTLAPPI